jgi:hypothetical protein
MPAVNFAVGMLFAPGIRTTELLVCRNEMAVADAIAMASFYTR